MSDRAEAHRAGLDDADLVLFDLDGTLVASEPGILACVRHALSTLGEPVPSAVALTRFVGPPLHESFQRECGLDEERAWAAVAAYRERYAERGQFESVVYDGIPELLALLRGAGRTLIVATSKPEVYAGSILEHFDLAGQFPVVVGSELDGTRSDKADVVAEALSRSGRLPGGAARAVMVGDRSHDMLGAVANGIAGVGALWGYGSAEELVTAGATALAATPQDVAGLLLG